MNYLSWKEENIFTATGKMPSEKTISEMYNCGFVFTRIGKGIMQQTRSVRIDLSKFELSSENRRILKKINPVKNDKNLVVFDGVTQKEITLPLPLPVALAAPIGSSQRNSSYHWSMAKLAKDFYEKKFGPGIMSAAKIKELLTEANKSNFNLLLVFSFDSFAIGYAICYKNADLLHYSYPFYDLTDDQAGKPALPKDTGLGMMIMAIEHAKKSGLRYIYLGSLQRPTDTYKLQFKGIEWFDGGSGGTGTWQSDIEKVKSILK